MKRYEPTADPKEAWYGDSFFSTARHIITVAAGGGRLVAGGDRLYMMRPGEERMVELDLGYVSLVACESEGRRRFAAQTEDKLIIFDGGDSMEVSTPTEDDQFMSLAFGRWKDGRSLFGATIGGKAVVLDEEAGGMIQFLETDPEVHRLAADGAGRIMLLDDDGSGGHLFDASKDSAQWIPFPEDIGEVEDVALAGDNIAVCDCQGVWVKRGRDAEFEPCEELELPQYPTFCTVHKLAFQGMSPTAAVLTAFHIDDRMYIARIDAKGALQTLEESKGAGGSAPPIPAMVWDSAREALFSARMGDGLWFLRRNKKVKWRS